jgi:hypothetical protein
LTQLIDSVNKSESRAASGPSSDRVGVDEDDHVVDEGDPAPKGL